MSPSAGKSDWCEALLLKGETRLHACSISFAHRRKESNKKISLKDQNVPYRRSSRASSVLNVDLVICYVKHISDQAGSGSGTILHPLSMKSSLASA